LFGNAQASDLESMEESLLLSATEGIPSASISEREFSECPSVTDLLSDLTGKIIFPSKGEARKMIQGGGVSINKEKVSDPAQKPAYKLLHGKFLLAQKGKKNYFLIRVEKN